jgi:hypothetical protein
VPARLFMPAQGAHVNARRSCHATTLRTCGDGTRNRSRPRRRRDPERRGPPQRERGDHARAAAITSAICEPLIDRRSWHTHGRERAGGTAA